LRVTVAPDGSLEIVGELDANWLPEAGEIGEPPDEARYLVRGLQALQDGNNDSPFILRTMEPP
jgi:hypothetical protein